MKKNPLSEIYESKVLTSEAVPSDKVKGEKELDTMINAKKAQPVKDQGPAGVKGLKKPEEAEGTDVIVAVPKVLGDSVEAERPTKAFEGSFEKLFKATITEQFPGEEEVGVEMDIEVPTSNDEMMDELEGKEDEVSDLVSDLKDLMSKLQTILDKVTEENGEEKDEAESEFGDEEAEAEEEVRQESVEEPVEEATELKPLGDKSKVLQNKNNKVGGSPKVHGGKAHGGDVDADPELKPAKSFDKSLQSPKTKPEVKSTVKKGDFFK